MSTPDFDIDRIAELARLELGAEEKAAYTAQLGDILAYVEKFAELDLEGIEPTAHAHPTGNVVREDAADPDRCLGTELTLSNAPEKSGDQFRVPKVVD